MDKQVEKAAAVSWIVVRGIARRSWENLGKLAGTRLNHKTLCRFWGTKTGIDRSSVRGPCERHRYLDPQIAKPNLLKSRAEIATEI